MQRHSIARSSQASGKVSSMVSGQASAKVSGKMSAKASRRAALSALLLTPVVMAQPQATLAHGPTANDLRGQITLLKDQLEQQRRALEALQAAVDAQRLNPRGDGAGAGVGINELDNMRGAGNPGFGTGPQEGAARIGNGAADNGEPGNGAPANGTPQATGAAAADIGTAAESGTAVQAATPAAAVRRRTAAANTGNGTAAAGAAGATGTARTVGPAGIAAAAGAAQPGNAGGTSAAPRQAGNGGANGASDGAVGKPPPRDSRPPAVAPLFEQPGVLTPRGKFVLEPSAQFGYSSSNRVALVGYTVIPALLIGLIDVREVKRNTLTAALTGRVGLSNRLEAELKLPYVYRSDSTVSRELFTGTAVERVFDTSGRALGDVEAALRYQLNDGGADKSYYVGGLRFKSRTGRDPFSVVTDCTRRCIGDNVSGTGLPLELPTGSGFYSLQPSLTWLLPSDPAVFFGSVSYLHNFKRSGVSRLVLGGEREPLGEVKPGDVIGFNFGMGLALNDKASLSLGYDHSTIARTRQNGVAVPGSVRTQLGTLLVGFSYRLNEKRTVNVAIGAGLTRDTPDVSLTIRVPTSF
ncbi:MAG: acetate kinase [Massilia sp.]|nr:acetate kinase [Massilia sp.]